MLYSCRLLCMYLYSCRLLFMYLYSCRLLCMYLYSCRLLCMQSIENIVRTVYKSNYKFSEVLYSIAIYYISDYVQTITKPPIPSKPNMHGTIERSDLSDYIQAKRAINEGFKKELKVGVLTNINNSIFTSDFILLWTIYRLGRRNSYRRRKAC